MKYKLAEVPFFSIQGEGSTIGMPANFIRLAGCSLRCSFCFVGETLVETTRGLRPIKDIRVGENVISFDGISLTTSRVINVHQRVVPRAELLKVYLSNKECLVTTRDHRFYTKEGKWVFAKDLREGLELYSISKAIRVEAIETLSDKLLNDIKVYNLSCQPERNYFVHGVLAHNCDTPYSWREYREMEVDEILNRLNSKCKRVVITGGEPLEQDLTELLRALFERGYIIEVETNGTKDPQCLCYVSKWTVSPKLRSSNVPLKQRIRYNVLKEFVKIFYEKGNVEFKFAVSDLSDFKEMINLIERVIIPRQIVSVMPVGTSSQKILELLKVLVEPCKREGLRLLPRLQVLIWESKRGV